MKKPINVMNRVLFSRAGLGQPTERPVDGDDMADIIQSFRNHPEFPPTEFSE